MRTMLRAYSISIETGENVPIKFVALLRAIIVSSYKCAESDFSAYYTQRSRLKT